MKEPRLFNIHLKYVALIALVAQTCAAIHLVRISRIPSPSAADPSVMEAPKYISTTAVFFAEILKMVCSLLIVLFETNWSLFCLCRRLRAEIFLQPLDTAKVGFPSGLYTLQNNLIFLALSNLSGAMYQVTYQLKILTTAALSVMILNKKLTGRKWRALFLLTAGVALIQMPAGESTPTVDGNKLIGFTAVLCASLTSGFAGVYFEKILKGSTTSIWMRNIQLGFFGSILALIGVWWKDGAAIKADGLLQGYNPIVWAVVVVQAVGGLIVAAVLKYADNILKCFGNAAAIILSCLISYQLVGDFQPTSFFLAGGALVLAATWMYSVEPRNPGYRDNKHLEEKGGVEGVLPPRGSIEILKV